MQPSKRITISGRNLQFLQHLSADMDEKDLTKVCEYLLADIRLLGYKIGDKVAQPVTQESQQQQQQTTLGYSFNTTAFEKITPLPDCDRNYQEIDPIIARMASLLEDF